MAQQELDLSRVLKDLKLEDNNADNQDNKQDKASKSLQVAEMERLIDKLQLELCHNFTNNIINKDENPFVLAVNSSCNYNIDNVILSLYDEQGRNPNYLGPQLKATTSNFVKDDISARHSTIRMVEHNDYFYDDQSVKRVNSEDFLLQLLQSKQEELSRLEDQLAIYREQLQDDFNFLEVVNRLPVDNQDHSSQQRELQTTSKLLDSSSLEAIQQQTLVNLAKLTVEQDTNQTTAQTTSQSTNRSAGFVDDSQVALDNKSRSISSLLARSESSEQDPSRKLVVTINSQGKVSLSPATTNKKDDSRKTQPLARGNKFAISKKNSLADNHYVNELKNSELANTSSSLKNQNSFKDSFKDSSKDVIKDSSKVQQLTSNLLMQINNAANGDVAKKLELIALASQVLDSDNDNVSKVQRGKTRDLLLSLLKTSNSNLDSNKGNLNNESQVTQVPQYIRYPKYQERNAELAPTTHRHLSLLNIAKLHADHEQAMQLLMQSGYLGSEATAQSILTQRVLANTSLVGGGHDLMAIGNSTDASVVNPIATTVPANVLATVPKFSDINSLQLANSSVLSTLPVATLGQKQQSYPVDFNGSKIIGSLNSEITTSETSTTQDKVITKPSKGVKIVSRTSSTTQTRTIRQIIQDDGVVVSQVIDTNVSYEAVTDTLESGELQTSSSRTVAKKMSSNSNDIVQAIEQSKRNYNIAQGLPGKTQQVYDDAILSNLDNYNSLDNYSSLENNTSLDNYSSEIEYAEANRTNVGDSGRYLGHIIQDNNQSKWHPVQHIPTAGSVQDKNTGVNYPQAVNFPAQISELEQISRNPSVRQLLQSFLQRQQQLDAKLDLQTALINSSNSEEKSQQLMSLQQESNQLVQEFSSYFNSLSTAKTKQADDMFTQDKASSFQFDTTPIMESELLDTVSVNGNLDVDSILTRAANTSPSTENSEVSGNISQLKSDFSDQTGVNYQDLQVDAKSAFSTSTLSTSCFSNYPHTTVNDSLVLSSQLSDSLMFERALIHLANNIDNSSPTLLTNAIDISMDKALSDKNSYGVFDCCATDELDVVDKSNILTDDSKCNNKLEQLVPYSVISDGDRELISVSLDDDGELTSSDLLNQYLQEDKQMNFYPVSENKVLSNIFSDDLEDNSFVDRLFDKFQTLSTNSDDVEFAVIGDDNSVINSNKDVKSPNYSEITVEDDFGAIDYEALTARLKKLACQFSITPEEFDAKLRHYLFSDDDFDCQGNEVCEKVFEIRNEVRANLRDSNTEEVIEQLTDAFESVLITNDPCTCMQDDKQFDMLGDTSDDKSDEA